MSQLRAMAHAVAHFLTNPRLLHQVATCIARALLDALAATQPKRTTKP